MESLFHWPKIFRFNQVWVLPLLCFFTFQILAATQKPQSLPKEKIWVGGKPLKVEVARTPSQLSLGLMYRQKLDENSGMLFIFPETKVLSFWMKNTFIPLSIGFFGEDRRLIEVLDMEPVTSIMQVSIPHYNSSKPAKYALEVNRGWFKKQNIKPGALLRLDTKSK